MTETDLYQLDQVMSRFEKLIDKTQKLLVSVKAEKELQWVTAKDACEIADISYPTLQKMVASGIVRKAHKSGFDPKYNLADVIEARDLKGKHSKK